MRRDVRKKFTKGLTGKEAGKLIVQDSWEVDGGREGFLSDADIQRIKNSLNTPQDMAAYNAHVQAYRAITYTVQETRVYALQAAFLLEKAQGYLSRYYEQYLIDKWRSRAPIIMTQKQYEEEREAIRRRQREIQLQEVHTLTHVIEQRAYHLASEEQQEEAGWDAPSLCDEHPELFYQAAGQILELIQAGQLRPVVLQAKDKERLESLAQRAEAKRQETNAQMDAKEEVGLLLHAEEMTEEELNRYIETEPPNWDEFHTLHEEADTLSQELYQAGRKSWSQESIAGLVSYLEQPKKGSWPEDYHYDATEYALCSGQELYQAGISEWVGWIDEYQEDLYERDISGHRVAIILEPKDWQLDERGYYKGSDGFWEDFTLIRAESEKMSSQGMSLVELIQETTEQARSSLKDFLASRQVIEELSAALDTPFTEVTDGLFEGLLEPNIDRYNAIARVRRYKYLPESFRPSTVRLSMLKPPPKLVRYLRERMAMSLGDDWYREEGETLETASQEGEEAADG